MHSCEMLDLQFFLIVPGIVRLHSLKFQSTIRQKNALKHNSVIVYSIPSCINFPPLKLKLLEAANQCLSVILQ